MLEPDELDPHGLDPPILTSFLDDFPLLPLEEALRPLEGYEYRVTEGQGMGWAAPPLPQE